MAIIECLICDGELTPIPKDHEEYYLSKNTYDGTRRWYCCSKCSSVIIKDKQLGRWYVSAKTYTKLVEEGQIEDRLED